MLNRQCLKWMNLFFALFGLAVLIGTGIFSHYIHARAATNKALPHFANNQRLTDPDVALKAAPFFAKRLDDVLNKQEEIAMDGCKTFSALALLLASISFVNFLGAKASGKEASS